MSLKAFLPADQHTANTFKLNTAESPCCGDGATMCQYTTTYTAANTVTAITIVNRDGDNQTLTFSAVSGAANVRAAIIAALLAEGYESVNDNYESLAITGTTTFTVTSYSDVELVSLTHSGGTASFTKACTQSGKCTFTKTESTTTTGNTLTVNGITTALINITPSTTLGSAIDTSVTAAFTAAGVTADVTVSPTGAGASYAITMVVPAGTRVSWNGVALNTTGCTTAWS